MITFHGSTACKDQDTAAVNNLSQSQRRDTDDVKIDAYKCGRKARRKPRKSEVKVSGLGSDKAEGCREELSDVTTSYERQNASSRLASSGQLSPEPEDVRGKRQGNNVAHDLIESCLISFTRDILKLIQLILDSKQSPIRSALDYDFSNETIRVTGTKEFVLNTKLELHEIANSAVVVQSSNFCCRSIEGVVSSDKGERRLREEFSADDLLAAVHSGHIVAKDDETLKKSLAVVKRIFTTEDLEVKDEAVAYLRSTSWTENLTDLQASRLISVEYLESEKILRVAGCRKDVQESAINLRKLLELNCAVTISIKSKRGIVRLLKNSNIEIVESNRWVYIFYGIECYSESDIGLGLGLFLLEEVVSSLFW